MSDGKRKLVTLGVEREHLQQATIMNSALAAKYGAAYVRLAAFAIDIDRVYDALEDEDVELPFGWEVFITECYAVSAVSGEGELERGLLEETCLSILEQPPDQQGYGSQLLFAVHAAIEGGFYPGTLAPMFRSWRKPPKQLARGLLELWQDAQENLSLLAAHALAVLLEPPIAPPTQKALEQMAEGRFQLPRAALPS